jgi:hypothetical protein
VEEGRGGECLGDGECEGECQFDVEQPDEVDGGARGVGCDGWGFDNG